MKKIFYVILELVLFEDWIKSANYEMFKNEIEFLYETNEKWRIVIESSWHNPEELERKIRRNNIND